MRLKTQTKEKSAAAFSLHPAFEAEDRERRHHQTRSPISACLCFPTSRLRVTVTAFYGLRKTMHTTLRIIRLLGNVAYALIVVATKKGEHPKAFGPKFHVERGCETFGLASETDLPEGR